MGERVPDDKKPQKTYHKRASGPALQTAEAHASEHSLKLYGSCFCPFVQRIWIQLEHQRRAYQYIEVDPYAKPKLLLDINPKGLVPALLDGDFPLYESTVVMDYLEDTYTGGPEGLLLPTNAQKRASERLGAFSLNRNIIPGFYRLLQEQDTTKHPSLAQELSDQIRRLVETADPQGPFFGGSRLGYVDVMFAPWMLRLRRVLGFYRGWPEPDAGTRWGRWVDAVEASEAVKSTLSKDELYIDSYERYAENRPNTSEVAKAINAGHALP